MSKALSNVLDFHQTKDASKRSPDFLIFLFVLAVCAVVYKLGFTESAPKPKPKSEPKAATTPAETGLVHKHVESDVQMALILDTSSSMDGLIKQAREQILAIAKDLQTDENGKPRKLALALYRYGSDRAPESDGYIQCLVPLTTDHEQIVEALNWLEAGGSEEYAPLAISTAVEELAWNLDRKTPKVVVIVGNETFASGPKSSAAAFKLAGKQKIKILPIYCVGKQASTSALSGWRRAAHLAGTEFQMIDPNLVAENLEKPIDRSVYDELAEKAEKAKANEEPIKRVRRRRGSRDRDIQFAPPRSPVKMKEIPAYRRPKKSSETSDFRSGVRRGVQGVLSTY